MDANAIKELQKTELIKAANDALDQALDPRAVHTEARTVALPDSFKLHDLEKFASYALRFRGGFATHALDAFREYCISYAGAGAAVFVDASTMQARAVLDLGTAELPGHGESTAELAFKETPEFAAFRTAQATGWMSQKAFIEFFEDYAGSLALYKDLDDFATLSFGDSLQALRALTAENTVQSEFKTERLSESTSTFEQARISAANKLTPPGKLVFACVPYEGLSLCRAEARIRYSADNNKVVIKIAAIRFDAVLADIAKNAQACIAEAMGGSMPVYVGTFEKKAR